MIFDDQGNQKPNASFVNRYLYAAYLKGKKTTRKSTCCACCSWWCCKGGRGCAEVSCLQTDCIASCLQTCASCCPTRIPDITNFGVAQFSHKYPYVQRWYNVLQFTKGNMQWVSSVVIDIHSLRFTSSGSTLALNVVHSRFCYVSWNVLQNEDARFCSQKAMKNKKKQSTSRRHAMTLKQPKLHCIFFVQPSTKA